MARTMTITPHRLFSLDYERLFTQMIVVSVVVHIGALVAAMTLPGLFPSKPPAPPPAIEIDLSVALPKGPGLSPQAPDRDQAALRRSDPRSMQDIQREREQELDNDTVRPTDRRPIPTNRLGFQDQLAMHAAVERIRQRNQPLVDSVGGGGTGEVSTSGILANYIALVRSRIMRVWTLPGGLPAAYLEKIIKVRVFVAPSGEIINQIMVEPSGLEPLDRSCLSAVIKANPLPSPPVLLNDKLRTEGIMIRFHPREKQH